MTLRKIGGVLAAWFVMFALAGLWHDMVMRDMYLTVMAGSARAEPDLVMVANGYLALALLMAWIYPRGYAGGSPTVEGAKFGAIMGLVWILPYSLVLSGVYEMSVAEALIDSAWHLAEGAVGGIVIGHAYGRPEAAASAG